MVERKKKKTSKRTGKIERNVKPKRSDVNSYLNSQKLKSTEYADNLIELNTLQLAILNQLKITLKNLRI